MTRKSLRGLLPVLILFTLGTTACTSSKVEPLRVSKKADQQYSEITVGELTTSNELWEHYLPHLRQGIVQGLRESEQFAKVNVRPEDRPNEGALVLSGRLLAIDEGDKALRFIIGFGAGSAEARGRFEISDERALLVSFTVETDYAGGAGIGGIDMMNMDELIQELGVDAAESTARWAQGKDLSDK